MFFQSAAILVANAFLSFPGKVNVVHLTDTDKLLLQGFLPCCRCWTSWAASRWSKSELGGGTAAFCVCVWTQSCRKSSWSCTALQNTRSQAACAYGEAQLRNQSSLCGRLRRRIPVERAVGEELRCHVWGPLTDRKRDERRSVMR